MTKRIRPSVQGFVVFRSLPGRAVRLDAVAVVSAFRNLGHCAQLLRAVENLGKRVRVHVPEESLAAQLFFRAIGFRAVRIKQHYFLGGQTAYCFEKVPESALRQCKKPLLKRT